MAKHTSRPERPDHDALEEVPIVRGNANRKTTRSESFVSFYANDVQFQTTPWDMRLTFGEIRVEPPSGAEGPTANVTENGEIRVSMQLAKRMLTIMSQQVAAYESRFGVIPQPRD